MALIPIEELGTPSQKTSLLGRVAQVLINPRPSPRLADVGLFVRPKSQQPPLEQRVSSPCKLNYLRTGRSNAPSRYPTLHCVGGRHALCEVPTAVGHSSTRTTAKFLESQTLASQGPIAPVGWAGPLRLCVIGGIYTSSNITHTHD